MGRIGLILWSFEVMLKEKYQVGGALYFEGYYGFEILGVWSFWLDFLQNRGFWPEVHLLTFKRLILCKHVQDLHFPTFGLIIYYYLDCDELFECHPLPKSCLGYPWCLPLGPIEHRGSRDPGSFGRTKNSLLADLGPLLSFWIFD